MNFAHGKALVDSTFHNFSDFDSINFHGNSEMSRHLENYSSLTKILWIDSAAIAKWTKLQEINLFLPT